MPIAQRQQNLFVAEDWRVIYRAFTEVNFSAYDFDTIRSALVDYIRINFPEDFNDWIESSEFVALIELLSYLGQSLSFRTDLNTRENFLDTAERRESVLRLARLVSFVPSRNRAAVGLVKITQLSTSQPLIDSNGTNIANRTVRWNDPNNPDWFEQFILILNSIFNETNPFGRPAKEGQISGITTQLYTLNNDPSANRVFPFNISVNGETLPFEIVNPDFTDGETFFEREPDPSEPLNIIFRNDGEGNASPTTGFFLMFKQGTLQKEDFRITVPIENRIINVQGTNINNSDVFVHEIDEDGFVINKWDKVPAVVGNNVIFNSLERSVRDIFSIITRPDDQISIRFADGRFGNVPTGLFRVWYRESNGTRYTIRPENMRNIRLDIPYFDGVNNNVFFASLTFSLQQSISNSAPADTSASIKNNAPQIFYTQDRMVNGEDYNVFPLRNAEAARIKAVNRIHSGFSRHIDINDPTGRSQNVNLFAEDGILYLEENNKLDELAVPSSLTEQEIINELILPSIRSLSRRHFFYFNYPRFEPTQPISSPAIAGVTGDDFTVGAEPYNVGDEITISDGVNTPVTVTFSTAPETISNAIIDINNALGALASDIIVQDGNPAPGQISLQISTTTGRSLTLTQVSGTFWSDVGILELGESSRTFNPRVFGTFWVNATNAVNSATGRFFIDADGIDNAPPVPIKVGDAVAPSTSEFHIAEGSLVKFADAGWVSVVSIIGDGDIILPNGNGAIQLSEPVDDNDWVELIIPPFRTELTDTENNAVLQQIIQKNSFGIRWDFASHQWLVITGDNIDTGSPFSFEFAGDNTGLNRDSSWLVRAEFNTTNWRFISRGLDFVFESDEEVRFHFSEDTRIVDSQTGRTVKDLIRILKTNPSYITSTVLVGDDGATTTVGHSIIINDEEVILTGTDVHSAVNDIESAGIPNISVLETVTGALQISSDFAITLEEGSGTALSDLGFEEGTFVDFQESNICNGLGENISFNIEGIFKEDDGFANPRKVRLTFTDDDEDGIPDNPTIFETITQLTNFGDFAGSNTFDGLLPDGEVDETELFWESFTNTDGFLEFRPSDAIKAAFNDTVPSFSILNGPLHNLVDGDVVFNRDTNEFFQLNETDTTLDDVTEEYFMRRGRNGLFFQWKHFAPPENRIDPAITNIIDMFVLTASYDIEIRQWIDDDGEIDEKPTAPTNEELALLFADEVDNKMISDEIIWHPVRYKVLFGRQAEDQLQARFKVTKVPGTESSDGEIKAEIIGAINEFFAINNFDFGETFYFTELAAFIHQRLATIISSVVLVPLDEEQKFGELFQVRSEPDEVFISAAKVSDIQIVEAFNDNILRIGR